MSKEKIKKFEKTAKELGNDVGDMVAKEVTTINKVAAMVVITVQQNHLIAEMLLEVLRKLDEGDVIPSEEVTRG